MSAHAKRAWQVTVDVAKAQYDGARGPTEIARAAIRLSVILRGPGFRREADDIVREAASRCRPAALRGQREAIEAFADLALHLGRSAEAIRLFEEAAAAGSSDAMQQIVNEMLDGVLVGVGAPVQAAAKALTALERKALALTGVGTERASYAYAGGILDISPDEVGRVVDRGLRALDPALLSPVLQDSNTEPSGLTPTDSNIGGVVETGGFAPVFEDLSHMPGEVIHVLIPVPGMDRPTRPISAARSRSRLTGGHGPARRSVVWHVTGTKKAQPRSYRG